MSNINEEVTLIQRRKYCKQCPSYSHSRMFLNDTPAIITWFFGAIIMYQFGLIILILYFLSVVLYVFGFSRLLCPYCPLYGTSSCTTGFGDIAATLFKKRDEKRFAEKYKIFIPLLSLLWFIPFVAGIYLIWASFSWFILGILIIFSIFGFVLVPLIPTLTYCKKCPLRYDCPWMKSSIDKSKDSSSNKPKESVG